MIHQSEANYCDNGELEFPEGQIEKDIDTNSPYQEEIIEQKYNRQADKYYRDNQELRRQVNASKMIHVPKQNYLNKMIKCIERKILRGSYLSMTVKEI